MHSPTFLSHFWMILSHFDHLILRCINFYQIFKTVDDIITFAALAHPYSLLSSTYNHPQQLWCKPPCPSFNVDFLSFRPARCTRQQSEPFQTIFTLSHHWIMGGRGGRGRWGLEGICKYIFDMSFVQFYLYSEFLLNFVLKSMLGKGKGQAKARNKEVNS